MCLCVYGSNGLFNGSSLCAVGSISTLFVENRTENKEIGQAVKHNAISWVLFKVMPNPSMEYDRIFRNLFYGKAKNIPPPPLTSNEEQIFENVMRRNREESKRRSAVCNNFQIEKVVDLGCAVNRKRDVYMIQEPKYWFVYHSNPPQSRFHRIQSANRNQFCNHPFAKWPKCTHLKCWRKKKNASKMFADWWHTIHSHRHSITRFVFVILHRTLFYVVFRLNNCPCFVLDRQQK